MGGRRGRGKVEERELEGVIESGGEQSSQILMDVTPVSVSVLNVVESWCHNLAQ